MKMRTAILLLLPPPRGSDWTRVDDPPTRGRATAVLREIVELTIWVEEGVNMIRCPLSGGARIVVTEKSMASGGDTVTVFGRWTIAPDRCEIHALGDTLVLEGDPSIVFEREFRYRGFLEEGWVDMEAKGTVAWKRNDGSSGTCEVDLAVENAEVDVRDTGRIDGALEGRLCGFDAAVHFYEL